MFIVEYEGHSKAHAVTDIKKAPKAEAGIYNNKYTSIINSWRRNRQVT